MQVGPPVCIHRRCHGYYCVGLRDAFCQKQRQNAAPRVSHQGKFADIRMLSKPLQQTGVHALQYLFRVT